MEGVPVAESGRDHGKDACHKPADANKINQENNHRTADSMNSNRVDQQATSNSSQKLSAS